VRECGIDLVPSGCCDIPSAIQSIRILRGEVRALNNPTETPHNSVAICCKKKKKGYIN